MTEYKIGTVGELLKALNDLVAVNPDVLNAIVAKATSSTGFFIQGYKSMCNNLGQFDNIVEAVSPYEINVLSFIEHDGVNKYDILRKNNGLVKDLGNKNKFKSCEELCKELSELDYDTAVMNISKQLFNYGEFCHIPGKGWMMLKELENQFKKSR